ncbi:MAG: DUF3392 domain-containing protein [Chitinispirillales bacterium]|jgi:Kef-type K+ transport system membrane component KefB|nr:DUF3392 domain-containing protein [Chitinispirillales bacterium]
MLHEIITINGVQILDYVANWLRSHTVSVSVAIVTTTIAIYGIYIGKAAKKITHNMNVIIRFAVYVFVYAFGIGFLSTYAVRYITKLLNNLDNAWLVTVICLVFSLLIYLANDEKQI